MDRMLSITNSVIADMSEGVMAISHKGIIELVNGAALSILGREKEELMGKLFAGFLGAHDHPSFSLKCQTGKLIVN